MTSANVARGLTVGADERALTMTLIDAVASEAFHDSNVFWDGGLIYRHPLATGEQTHTFPIFGESPEDAEHHTPGAFIEGGTLVQTNPSVTVDDPLIKALRIPWNDQTLAPFDLIEPSARECVRIVAEKQDRRAAVVGVNAARSAAVTNVHNGGNVVERVADTLVLAYPVSSTGASNFLTDLANMARLMDEDNIPETNRFCVSSPYIRQVLTNSDRVMNRDYVREIYGAVHDRTVGMVEGFQLILSQHLPSTTITTDLSKYNIDAAVAGAVGQPAALCLYAGNQRGAIGGVFAGGPLAMRLYWDNNRDCWLIAARLMTGLGVVEAWCAGEIRVDAA